MYFVVAFMLARGCALGGAYMVHVAEQILSMCKHLLAKFCAFDLSEFEMI